MKLYKRLYSIFKGFFALWILLTAGTVHAQRKDISFERFNLDNGLSSNNVNCVMQDSRGYIWFGTKDGLNRFDGYKFTVFRHDPTKENSLSQNQVLCLEEDKDGEILIGTFDGGLNIYNYETNSFRVLKHDPQNSSTISSNSIYDIYKDSENNVWIGTFGGGLSKLLDKKNGTFTNFLNKADDEKSLSNNAVFTICEVGEKKELWLGTYGGGINIFDKNGSFKRIRKGSEDPFHSLLSDDIYSIKEDKNGNVWIATSGSGVSKYNPRLNIYEHYRFSDSLKWSIKSDVVRSLEVDKMGNVWVGTEKGGLSLYDEQRNLFYTYQNNPADPKSISNNIIRGILADKGGSLWICTEGGGLSKFETSVLFFKSYQSGQDWHTLTANAIMTICETSRGDILIGTFQDGAYLLDQKTMTFKSFKQGGVFPYPQIMANTVLSIYEDSLGLIWMGTEDEGLFRIDPETASFIVYKKGEEEVIDLGDFSLDGDADAPSTPKPAAVTNKSENTKSGITSNSVQAIVEDRKGNIWIGTYDAGLCKYNRATDQFECYQNQEGDENSISSNSIKYIYETKDGKIWVGTGDAGVNVYDPSVNKFSHYKFIENDTTSLSNNTVYGIYQDQLGTIWVGTFGGGLCKYNSDKNNFSRITEAMGLANNEVCAITGDKEYIWVSTNRGLSRIHQKTGVIKNFRKKDGLPTDEFTPDALFLSNSGKMFFGGNKAFVYFEPEKLKEVEYVPPIYLTGLKKYDEQVNFMEIYGKPINQVEKIDLNYDDDFFTFEYVMLDLAKPDKVEYYYKMEGFDEKWIHNGNRREASYTNLDAGKTYTFMIKGITADGIESKEPASISVYITPAWYDTWQVKTTATLLILTLTILFIRNRISAIERQKQYLEKVVAERTAELRQQKAEVELQKDKSDQLLLNILPLETANELKEHGKVSPKHYRLVTVLFTDFKGFTNIAEKLSPEGLIDELNKSFMGFDQIIEEHNLEKIKTIGDAYMCAGGIPKENRTNPVDAVLVGLKIQQFMYELRLEKESKGEPFWQLRLGIHTGELVAGVIGKKKYAYDIWGDAVNTASRMESSGEPDKINISGTTYEYVKDFFVTEYRGNIQAKNKGEIPMYFVYGIKEELSVNGDGITPNERFFEKLEESVINW